MQRAEIEKYPENMKFAGGKQLHPIWTFSVSSSRLFFFLIIIRTLLERKSEPFSEQLPALAHSCGRLEFCLLHTPKCANPLSDLQQCSAASLRWSLSLRLIECETFREDLAAELKAQRGADTGPHADERLCSGGLPHFCAYFLYFLIRTSPRSLCLTCVFCQ